MGPARRKRYVEVAEELRDLIERGSFAPGARLPSERELVARFGVGRSTVREALTALQSTGLIEVRQGSGARVLAAASVPVERWLPGDRHSARDLIEARVAIECRNASMAALRATREDLARIAAIVTEMDAEQSRGEFVVATDLAFHVALAEATHNRVQFHLTSTLAHLIDDLLAQLYAAYADDPAQLSLLLDQHRMIFQAVVSGDPRAASHYMEEHLGVLERSVFPEPPTGLHGATAQSVSEEEISPHQAFE